MPEEILLHCVVCGDPIAPERVRRKAVTCSDAHYKTLKTLRRKLRTTSRCRLCNRPSTPEERAEFLAWRKSRGIKRGPKKQQPAEAAEKDEAHRAAAPEQALHVMAV